MPRSGAIEHLSQLLVLSPYNLPLSKSPRVASLGLDSMGHHGDTLSKLFWIVEKQVPDLWLLSCASNPLLQCLTTPMDLLFPR